MNEDIRKRLVHWLKKREYDIANSIEDLGELQQVYWYFVGRKPEGYSKKKAGNQPKKEGS